MKEGDAIKKGQLLATLNLTEIDASLQQAQLAYEKASRDLQRLNNLYQRQCGHTRAGSECKNDPGPCGATTKHGPVQPAVFRNPGRSQWICIAQTRQ